jgi:hypothetical protein
MEVVQVAWFSKYVYMCIRYLLSTEARRERKAMHG